LMTVQGALGLIVLFGLGLMGAGVPLERLLHSLVTAAAIVISFQFLRWDSAPAKTQARNNALAVAGALACAFAGMALLPGGWARAIAM